VSVEDAVRAYVAAWTERDPARRAQLLETCWADTGRLVTSANQYVGRAALSDAITSVLARMPNISIRLTSPIDVQGQLFRMRGVVEAGDGAAIGTNVDAGEVDADGRIATLLTFTEPNDRDLD
jgi:hypothetical protein